MRNYLVFIALLFSIASVSVQGDLLDCDEKKLPNLSDLGIVPKIASDETTSGEHEVRDFFKDLGCKLQKGATKVKEQAKKLGTEIKESARKLSERAKEYGSGLKTKLVDFKDKLSKETEDVDDAGQKILKQNFEMINPDILKSEQQCGHGHILDALGNCSKLRK